MTRASAVKGWCPGAHQPMMSGDGLVVRVRPFHARLDQRQVLGLCEAAVAYGNGIIDLTSRANLQLRGVAEADHPLVLEALHDLGLLDDTAAAETRRNILVMPFWTADDTTHRITDDLLSALDSLPDLPAKFGFAVDTGDQPLLQDASADIRIERSANGLIVRADGAEAGRSVAEHEIAGAVAELARWFADHRGADNRRMAQTVRRVALPAAWATTRSKTAGPSPAPGPHPLGALVGAAFGQMDARALMGAVADAEALRVTPWRMILLDGATELTLPGFICERGSPLLAAHACPGAPRCASATVETRALARELAAQIPGSLHVSGCDKSCAFRHAADVTLVGRNGRFDLVRAGKAWDAPQKRGLRPDEILTELKTHA